MTKALIGRLTGAWSAVGFCVLAGFLLVLPGWIPCHTQRKHGRRNQKARAVVFEPGRCPQRFDRFKSRGRSL